MKMMGIHARKITQKVMGSGDALLPFELVEGKLLTDNAADCVAAHDSGYTFKEQYLFVPPKEFDTDDWFGSITFAEYQDNWYPVGVCSAPEAQLINRRILTDNPYNHDSLISFAHLSSAYDILESLNKPKKD